jgi:hypothetical protein
VVYSAERQKIRIFFANNKNITTTNFSRLMDVSLEDTLIYLFVVQSLNMVSLTAIGTRSETLFQYGIGHIDTRCTAPLEVEIV